MAWQKIDDPDKSWELLHAGLLWFRLRGEETDAPDPETEFAHYNKTCRDSWHGHRKLWGSDNDYYQNSKYVLLEE